MSVASICFLSVVTFLFPFVSPSFAVFLILFATSFFRSIPVGAVMLSTMPDNSVCLFTFHSASSAPQEQWLARWEETEKSLLVFDISLLTGRFRLSPFRVRSLEFSICYFLSFLTFALKLVFSLFLYEYSVE